MKIIELDNRQIFDIGIDVNKSEYTSICPLCSSGRKKSKDKCFSWNNSSNVGYCHHCGSRFALYKPYDSDKQYYIPEPLNETKLTDQAKNWIVNKRFIPQTIINKMDIHSSMEWMPGADKEMNVICFPYYRDGKLVNIKYRDGKKDFKFIKGAELLLYNHDCIILNDTIIITEGEFDALTFMACGFDNVVSMPNGAKNFEIFDNYSELFRNKNLIISVDNDIPGQELKNEIIRRFGADICSIVNLKDTKDANEYFQKYTYDLKKAVDEAEPVPVKGMVEIYAFRSGIRKLFEEGIQPGLKINRASDQYITFETRRLMIVTGIPGHGKSHYVNDLIARLNNLYKWKAAFFTPENYPLEYHYRQMFELFIGKPFTKTKCDEVEYDMAYEHIRDNFFYILNEDDMKPESIINTAIGFVRRKGIKVLVIDPYNKIEHQSKSSENETQYISRFLDMLVNFAKFKDILVILIAHPRKMQRIMGQKHEVPTLYDISGSANFYNKADYGITIYRDRDEKGLINKGCIHFQKIKFRHLGKTGVIEFRFNYNNGRFEDQEAIDHWDNKNWLIKENNPFLIDETNRII